MADTAYDSDALRQVIADKGAAAVIPNNPSHTFKHPLDKHLYAQRHLVECCFSKLKQFRRVATRFEKTARNYSAIITLAAMPYGLDNCPHRQTLPARNYSGDRPTPRDPKKVRLPALPLLALG